MLKTQRNLLIVVLGALFITGVVAFAKASTTISKSDNSLGAKLTKSSTLKDLKIGHSLVYKGVEPSHKTIEVILTKTKSGWIALDGSCTVKGEVVTLKKTQLICASQGSVYQASTGAVLLGPNGSSKDSIPPLNRFTITEKSGWIWIK